MKKSSKVHQLNSHSVAKEGIKKVDAVENCNSGENLNNSGTSKAVPVSPDRKAKHAGNEIPNSHKRSRKK